ncbi:hypothetical protein [Endozoicomonas ascidiicola]|uniref:hypothetical protein n=1 Tax=Endozoicomonas ascidiicola TaxID=1698521 RepID=UPI000831C987|nr:hypothetical protein [Endozoicomonas ascidiicola]
MDSHQPAAQGASQYSNVESRRQAFIENIVSSPNPAACFFAQKDVIRYEHIYETLIVHGLIPAQDRQLSISDRWVTCFHCNTSYEVNPELNPLDQHLEESQPGLCDFAVSLLDEYPTETIPFLSPQTALSSQAGTSMTQSPETISASYVVHRAEPLDINPDLPGTSRQNNQTFNVVENNRSPDAQKQIIDTTKAIDAYFNKSVPLKNGVARKYAEVIIDSSVEKNLVEALLIFLKKLDHSGERVKKQCEVVKEVLDTLVIDPSLVEIICADAQTIEGGCIDRRKEVLERMQVACRVRNVFVLPAGEKLRWSVLFEKMKAAFHDESFYALASTFTYHKEKKRFLARLFAKNKQLISHHEGAEIVGFYKHLLRHICNFSNEPLGLTYIGYKCPSADVFHKFQREFLERIEDFSSFSAYVQRVFSTQYERAFKFLCEHDDDFNLDFNLIDSKLAKALEDVSENTELQEQEQITKLNEIKFEREDKLPKAFKAYINDRLTKHWEAVRQSTVKGKLKSNLSLVQLKRLVSELGMIGDQYIEPISPRWTEEEKRFLAMAGVNIDER